MLFGIRAVDKFFSLGVLTFTTHHKQLCAVAMCYIIQIQTPKIWGCFSTHLSTALGMGGVLEFDY